MAFKQFALTEQINVTIYKRRGSRHLHLRIMPDGMVRVTIPTWTPYATGLQFAESKLEWITTQRPTTQLLRDGLRIGKAHQLRFASKAVQRPSGRLYANEAVVSLPLGMTADHPAAQKAAERLCIKALRLQAEQLLPSRLAQLAQQHGFSYKTVRVKPMSSRWGSCDQHRNITLNIFLMQLPWSAIDYVLLHELVHTKVLRHGPDFWTAFDRVLPSAKAERRAMRAYQPRLLTDLEA
ncbi:MAG TPA: YgjP-like metallopeptidase domain-containing protein [Candidatus Saccharimonadales bacterium]|nr:YgjP-like metallopeptidase domain-containing protein [Candidatus Saccharimonadales bacterium]